MKHTVVKAGLIALLAPELDMTKAITQKLKETNVDVGPLPEITRKAEADNTPLTH